MEPSPVARLASIAAYGFDDLPTARLLAVFARLGVSALQFYRNEAKPPTAADARRIAADAGLRFDSVHGVFGPQYDPSSPDDSVRRSSVAAYRCEGLLALELGGPAVVVHPSPQHTRNAKAPGPDDSARLDALRRSAVELAAIGREQGVMFLLENLPPEYAVARPGVVAQVVRELDAPQLRMCFDIGHAHMTGDAIADLDACRDVISYLHVHDNDASRDAHLIPGDGTLAWDRVTYALAALPPNVSAMLELFQPVEEFDRRIVAGLKGQLQRWLAVTS
jgi:sugar phosphate isomerase/epimerase